jgi:hypothetical protein
MHALIRHNAETIRSLHARIHQTVKLRAKDEAHRKTWEAACDDFHKKYDSLAFPGGYGKALKSIPAGDANSIEAAISFLEVRPYFFRSQYMMKKLRRLLNHCELSESQKKRFLAATKKAEQDAAANP